MTNKLSNSPSGGRCSGLRSAARSDRGATPGDEVDHERDHSADQQDVDEKACCMKRKEASGPQQQQKNSDSYPHCTRSLRPDLRRSFNRRLEEATSCLRFQSCVGLVKNLRDGGRASKHTAGIIGTRFSLSAYTSSSVSVASACPASYL